MNEEVFSSAADMHCIFMWTIDELLLECETYMQRRAYKRHCRIIWDKTNGVAPAFTVRYAHEYLIWYYKPKLMPIATNQRGKFTTIMQERRREHSRKPEAVYQMIEALYPGQAKIDVFSRQRRSEWFQFGDQLDHFPANIDAMNIKPK